MSKLGEDEILITPWFHFHHFFQYAETRHPLLIRKPVSYRCSGQGIQWFQFYLLNNIWPSNIKYLTGSRCCLVYHKVPKFAHVCLFCTSILSLTMSTDAIYHCMLMIPSCLKILSRYPISSCSRKIWQMWISDVKPGILNLTQNDVA